MPENSLRLVEVTTLASTKDILGNKNIYQPLAIAQLHEALGRNGSIGGGRVYCCGGKMDEAFFHYFYIALDILVKPGNIVEIRSVSIPKNGKSAVNTVTRVVQKKDDPITSCRWDPHNRVYGRILYCDWMLQEGWVRYKIGNLPYHETWLKLPNLN